MTFYPMNSYLLLDLVWGLHCEEKMIDLAWFNDTVGLRYRISIHNFHM